MHDGKDHRRLYARYLFKRISILDKSLRQSPGEDDLVLIKRLRGDGVARGNELRDLPIIGTLLVRHILADENPLMQVLQVDTDHMTAKKRLQSGSRVVEDVRKVFLTETLNTSR